MYPLTHPQPPLQRLDIGQASKLRTHDRGDTNPQPSSCVATTLQRRLLPRALAACLAQDKEFLEFFRDPDNRAPGFEFEYRT